jgi:two-component system sensor histidine kinase RegB
LLENAVDFARGRVAVGTQWNEDIVEVTIGDDGPGFAPDIMDRIGEPYVTSRRHKLDDADKTSAGLGLGFFIAKTLLERSGASLSFENRNAAPSSRCAGAGTSSSGRWRSRHLEIAAENY